MNDDILNLEIPATSSDEYRIASEAARSSTANVTEGRHAAKMRASEESERSPPISVDEFRRDGLPIISHDYDPSDGSDIIEDRPAEYGTVKSIMRIIDALQVVYVPGRTDGHVKIIVPDKPREVPTDECLGYSLCTINGTPSIRVWRPAVTLLERYRRKNKDGTDLIRPDYIPLEPGITIDVLDCLEQIYIVWQRSNHPNDPIRIPNFDKHKIADILERVATINGPVNRLLEIAQTTKWDKKPRIANFFKDLGYRAPVGILSPDEEAYYLECVARWSFVAMMERQIRPTVFDIIPILWGDGPDGNGTGKTTTVKAMASGFFGEAGRMPREKTATTDREFWKATIGNAICEMKEGQQWTKANNDALKALADQSTFSYVEKYQKNPQTHTVSCIFICTTNRKEIIQDPDGNIRRFLPLQAAQNADGEDAIDILKRLELEEPGYFDQIYAEALRIIEDSPMPCEVWRQGDETGRYAYDKEFMRGIQARVCRESLDMDPNVDRLAQYIKDRLTTDSIDAIETVEASEIEAEYWNNIHYDDVPTSERPKVSRALHKSGTAKLHGLEYKRYTINKRTIWGYRLLSDEGPPESSTRRRPSDMPGMFTLDMEDPDG